MDQDNRSDLAEGELNGSVECMHEDYAGSDKDGGQILVLDQDLEQEIHDPMPTKNGNGSNKKINLHGRKNSHELGVDT